MMEDFNRQTVIDNLMTLVQNSDMKVGEIEKKLGLSAGYISRLAKKENESALSAELLWKISRCFGVSVDTLVSEKMGQEDKMISYMRKFIARLVEKTGDGSMVWNPITVGQINNMLMGKCKLAFPVAFYHKAHFPTDLPAPSEDPIRIDNALSCYDELKVVTAVAGGMIVNPQGTVFWTWIGEGQAAKKLYLTTYCCDFEFGTEEYFELMLVDPDAEEQWWNNQTYDDYRPVNAVGEIPPYVEEVCNTFTGAWTPIKNEMRDLYRTVRSHEDDIQLTSGVKTTIDQFMSDDDDLPF